MDVASLSLKITTEGMPEAKSQLDGVTASGARAQAQIDKMRISGDELGEGTSKLVARQDAFLQQLERQAATLNKGGAALRAYKAEQLGLTDDKVFQKLNAQVAEAEAASSGMGRMVENMVMRMGLHMALFISVMKGVSWAYDEIAHGAQKWMEQAAKLAESDAKSAAGVATLAMAMKTNAESYANGTNVVNGYNGMLERESVLRAEMMAMGPEFRNAIYQENGHYSDQLTLLKQITAEKLKQTNAQIEMVEGNKPSGSALVGLGAGLSAVPGLGGLLMSSGLRDDVDEQIKYDERLDKLYKARAEMMKSIATLNGDYQKGANAMESIYEVNHRIYELEKITPLGAEKSVSANLLAPAKEKTSFNFQKVEDSTTSLMRKLRDAAESGNTFAAMGYEVARSGGYAADSMTRWMNNTDGLGRSWTTLGNTVRGVLADMLVQMENAILKQKLMDPLLKGLGSGIDAMGNGGGWSGFVSAFSSAFGGGKASGGSVYGGTTYLVGEQGPELFRPGVSGSIVPNHALGGAPTIVNQISVTVTDGKATTTADAGQGGENIAKNLKGLMNQWAVEQSRSGGLLAAR